MSVIMIAKQALRTFGFDVVRYHSFWDDIAQPRNFKTILDIGANDGSSARALRKRFPEAVIHSFEPLHGAFERLQSALEGDDRFHTYPYALGEKSETTIIHRSSSEASSSLLPMAGLHKRIYPKSATSTEETITVVRLDDILAQTDIDSPLLIKIDVQGFEASVLKGGPQIIRKADIVLIENSFVTLFEGQALFGDIHDLMREYGFEYHGRSETHYDPSTKAPIYEDSVFMKQRANA